VCEQLSWASKPFDRDASDMPIEMIPALPDHVVGIIAKGDVQQD
jgi:hypothetical protein